MIKLITVEMLGFGSRKSEAFTKPNNPLGSSLVSMVTVRVFGEPNLAPLVMESSVTVKTSRCSGMSSLMIDMFTDEEFWPLEK